MSTPPTPIGDLFDQLADDYDEIRDKVGWSPWPHLHAALSGRSPTGMKFLDVGCGAGEIPAYLLEQGASVIGIDASERMCELASENAPAGLFIHASLGTPLPFKDDTFDFTLALGCLEYVEDQDAACAELVRVTRPGGTVLYVAELRGFDLPAGPEVEASLYDEWRRYRQTFEEASQAAEKILPGAKVKVVEAYLLEDIGQQQLYYARVIGTAPGIDKNTK